MPAYWVVAMLLLVVTALNSLAVVALIRQVGLLHIRIRPLPALVDADGPQPGMDLVFDAGPWDSVVARGRDRLAFVFFSPTCSLCGPILPGIQRLAGERPEEFVLVTDTTPERAREYLNGKHIASP